VIFYFKGFANDLGGIKESIENFSWSKNIRCLARIDFEKTIMGSIGYMFL